MLVCRSQRRPIADDFARGRRDSGFSRLVWICAHCDKRGPKLSQQGKAFHISATTTNFGTCKRVIQEQNASRKHTKRGKWMGAHGFEAWKRRVQGFGTWKRLCVWKAGTRKETHIEKKKRAKERYKQTHSLTIKRSSHMSPIHFATAACVNK